MSRRQAKPRKQASTGSGDSTDTNLFQAAPKQRKPAKKSRKASAPPVETCSGMPRLALVRGDEEDGVVEIVEKNNLAIVEQEPAIPNEIVPPLTLEVNEPQESEIDDDTWPWIEETSKKFEDLLVEHVEEDHLSFKSDEIESLCASAAAELDQLCVEFHDGSEDHSQAQDVILCEPPEAYAAMLELKYASARETGETYDLQEEMNEPFAVVEAGDDREEVEAASEPVATPVAASWDNPMPELPPAGEIVKLGVSRVGVAPNRIGDGSLIPTKLSWKPGDPFAGEDQPIGQRFRWELMLTAACITAVCGMGCVWLLRSVFA